MIAGNQRVDNNCNSVCGKITKINDLNLLFFKGVPKLAWTKTVIWPCEFWGRCCAAPSRNKAEENWSLRQPRNRSRKNRTKRALKIESRLLQRVPVVLLHLVKWKACTIDQAHESAESERAKHTRFVSTIHRDCWQPMYYNRFDLALTVLAGLAWLPMW